MWNGFKTLDTGLICNLSIRHLYNILLSLNSFCDGSVSLKIKSGKSLLPDSYLYHFKCSTPNYASNSCHWILISQLFIHPSLNAIFYNVLVM